jgi:serine/threonine protein kinase
MEPPIVHGDLKAVSSNPDSSLQIIDEDDAQNNVLITDDHHAVLSDFGLSKVIDELVTSTGNVTSTQGGCVRWQAPELVVVGNADLDDQLTPARSVTRVSDVWSFGCTAYEVRSPSKA